MGCGGFLLPNKDSSYFLSAFLIIFRLFVNTFSGLNLSLLSISSLFSLFSLNLGFQRELLMDFGKA